jgi:hypothetical protein
MNSACFQRTSGWPSGDDPRGRRARPKGSISIVVTLMFLAFTVLGMSMAVLVQAHLRAGAGRKNSVILDYASENGIKRALTEILGRLETGETLREISPEQEASFRSDMRSGGSGSVEDFFAWTFPRQVREAWKSASWESTLSCTPEEIDDREAFTSVSYGFRIDSTGSLTMFKPKRVSSCAAALGAMVGRLPLPCIPLLVEQEMSPEERAEFLKRNGISFAPGSKDAASQRLQSAGAPVISDFPESLLGQALRIRIFKPEDLKPAVLRRALGLEPTSDPVPDGVYLIRDDLGLGGVFVQGDLDEMITVIEEDCQSICFRSGDEEWVLKFSPSREKTWFASPAGAESFERIPSGTICVNGKILSLGGGFVDADGRIRIATDKARPSILSGVCLNIISSEEVNLTSHLISQGVRWKEGVPYVKDGNSQLMIYSTGRDLVSGEAREARISADAGGPNELEIQASLVARGEGVVVEGRGRTLHVLGGIQASNIAGEGNAIKITPANGLDSGRPSPEGSPLTARPMAYLSFFRVREWREY